MGLFSGTSAKTSPLPLPPAPHPIGVNKLYTQHTTELALRVREHKTGLSGDDFTVKDASNGQKLFEVVGKVMSWSGKKDVKDAKGLHLFTICKERIPMSKIYVGDDAKTGREIFRVESSLLTAGAKLRITFNNTAGSGEKLTLSLRGDWFDRKADITLESGQKVARISRDFINPGEAFFNKQTYILTIAPNVDASLFLAICICLDEAEND